MKNFDMTMTAGFEKMGSRRGAKKDKSTHAKSSPSIREQQYSDDYEEYFNTRYGNKLNR